jgi:predicted nucleic-acid-binding Zn-ribbon protein
MVAKKKASGKKKTTKFTARAKAGHCPKCGSVNIEPSYGTAGYTQCNHCGNEWR